MDHSPDRICTRPLERRASPLKAINRSGIGHDIANADDPALGARSDDDVFKLFNGIQSPQRIDRVLKTGSGGRGRRANLSSRNLNILFLDCIDHVLGRQPQ